MKASYFQEKPQTRERQRLLIAPFADNYRGGYTKTAICGDECGVKVSAIFLTACTFLLFVSYFVNAQ